MNFDYSEAECMVRDVARRFLADHATIAAKLAAEQTDAGYSAEVWTEIAALGWLHLPGLATGEDIGVLGVLAEEVGRASFASPLITCAAASLVLARAGGVRVEKLLARIGDGECVAGLVQPHAAKNPLGVSDANPGLRLTGGPVLVEWGSTVDSFIVPMQQTDASCVMRVDRHASGLDIKPARTFDNARAAILTFDNVAVSPEDIFEIRPEALNEVLGLCSLLVTAEAVGGSYGALELTTAYVKEREQFGHPIGSFQAIKHGLADVRGLIDGAWLVTWEGISKAICGEPLGGSPALASWVTKRAFQEAAIKGSQYHGGMGHTIESHMQFYYRRSGTFHCRCGNDWDLLGQIAEHYAEPNFNAVTT